MYKQKAIAASDSQLSTGLLKLDQYLSRCLREHNDTSFIGSSLGSSCHVANIGTTPGDFRAFPRGDARRLKWEASAQGDGFVDQVC